MRGALCRRRERRHRLGRDVGLENFLPAQIDARKVADIEHAPILKPCADGRSDPSVDTAAIGEGGLPSAGSGNGAVLHNLRGPGIGGGVFILRRDPALSLVLHRRVDLAARPRARRGAVDVGLQHWRDGQSIELDDAADPEVAEDDLAAAVEDLLQRLLMCLAKLESSQRIQVRAARRQAEEAHVLGPA